MRTLGNIIWLVLSGFWMAIGWGVAGLVCCITIIGIPFGIQCFKLAGFMLWPFGHTVVHDPDATSLGILGNILWFIPGLFLAAGYVLSGIALCITIIGIPFGIQNFKFVPLALFPFGKVVVDEADLAAAQAARAMAVRPLGS